MKSSFLKLLVLVLGLTSSLASYGSAMVHLDVDHSLITVKGQIIFYGPLASEEVAQKATTEVQTYWNGGTDNAPATQYFTTLVKGKKYQVTFEITHQVVTVAEAAQMQKSNPSPELTFIQVLQGNAAAGDRSYMTGLGSNQGVWYLSDNLGLSSTTAHEYGHGLGLDHPMQGDWRGRGQPAIMCPRGTIVDADYQYTPTAPAGGPGGTMSPYKRKVVQWDINNLQFGKLAFDSSGMAPLNKALDETPWSKDPTESTEDSFMSQLHPTGRVY